MSEEYDLFISYKSSDASTVRAIAALLTTLLGMFMFPPFFAGIALIHHAAYWMGMGFVAYLLGVNIPRMMGDIDL
ncbi:MAG: hypothetical protein BroJett018_54410 [Chloroflexota bacterium]|nr:MAG: hypothetical protein BroJett018_54410 [Chloroflexota bacterium]